MDHLVDGLFMALPATTYQEIAEKLSSRLRRPVSPGDVNNVLNHLRRNSRKYGWTVPHVRRSVPVDGIDNDRFFAVLVNGDGSLEYEHPEQSEHALRGYLCTMRSTSTQHSNEARAVEAIGLRLPPEYLARAKKLARKLMTVSNEEKLLLEDISTAFGLAA